MKEGEVMTVLDIVKAKVYNPAIAEFDMEIAIAEVEQVIKNYCSLEIVPDELKYTWANMAVDLLLYSYQTNVADAEVVGDISEIDSADISSLSVGDIQVGIGKGGSSGARSKALSSHKPRLDELVMNYTSQLKKFRRMVW